MTVNTECGLLLTYVPTYRNARASEGRRYRACTVSACKQRWPPSSGSHIQLTPRMHADTRRRVARVRSPVSQPPAQVQGSSGSSSGASSGPQARAQGLRRELRVAAGPAAVPRRGANRFSSWSHQSKSTHIIADPPRGSRVADMAEVQLG